jgi:protein-L-isoaspartate(D-aspartate) O-methyltransferase
MALRVKAFADARKRLIKELFEKGIKDKNVLDAFQNVPRHMFVPYVLRFDSYKNTALPIGKNQTISQPLTVAMMTQELELTEKDKVLEIGTGSGFQTAIIAYIVDSVHTIEVIPEFSLKAREIHKKLGFKNIAYKIDNGSNGWKEFAPFQKIMVTAALQSYPEKLFEQLDTGRGIIIFPLIKQNTQLLIKATFDKNKFSETVIDECNFVTAK